MLHTKLNQYRVTVLPAPNHLKKGNWGQFLIKKGTLRDQFSIKIEPNLKKRYYFFQHKIILYKIYVHNSINNPCHNYKVWMGKSQGKGNHSYFQEQFIQSLLSFPFDSCHRASNTKPPQKQRLRIFGNLGTTDQNRNFQGPCIIKEVFKEGEAILSPTKKK